MRRCLSPPLKFHCSTKFTLHGLRSTYHRALARGPHLRKSASYPDRRPPAAYLASSGVCARPYTSPTIWISIIKIKGATLIEFLGILNENIQG
jgi:hypothetical protein